MGISLQYYANIIKKNIENYSNPLFRRVRGKNSALTVWKFGDKNPDKIIYFITDVSTIGSGIFSLYLDILEHVSFAKAMGWIPVVDDTPQLLRKTRVVFRKNKNVMNEYFDFNNPISVHEVIESQQVIISSVTDKRYFRNIPIENSYRVSSEYSIFECDASELVYWRNFAKENLRYKDFIQVIQQEAYARVIGSKQNVLGVAIREGKMGMNEQGCAASSETEQPSFQEVIMKTEECLKNWKCRFIYLSCESDKAIEIFKNHFGSDMVLYLERFRLDYEYLVSCKSMKDAVQKDSKKSARCQNYQQIDLEYIEDMYILSRCESCILPVNCGTKVAYIQSDGYKHMLVM